MSQYTLQDPRSQYPKPPFPKQPQSAPGLAQKMEPKPDHGEASYMGSERLKGRKALIRAGTVALGGRLRSLTCAKVPTWPLITFQKNSQMLMS
jgi:hypothetical protein